MVRIGVDGATTAVTHRSWPKARSFNLLSDGRVILQTRTDVNMCFDHSIEHPIAARARAAATSPVWRPSTRRLSDAAYSPPMSSGSSTAIASAAVSPGGSGSVDAGQPRGRTTGVSPASSQTGGRRNSDGSAFQPPSVTPLDQTTTGARVGALQSLGSVFRAD